MRGECPFRFFDLESEDCLAHHDFTLLIKGFAWRQSLYTRSLSGQQGFLLLKRFLYRGIWAPVSKKKRAASFREAAHVRSDSSAEIDGVCYRQSSRP